MTEIRSLAVVSGCLLTIGDPEQERRYQQHIAMARLYALGCRKIVAPKRLPNTGDAEVYLLRGFRK